MKSEGHRRHAWNSAQFPCRETLEAANPMTYGHGLHAILKNAVGQPLDSSDYAVLYVGPH